MNFNGLVLLVIHLRMEKVERNLNSGIQKIPHRLKKPADKSWRDKASVGLIQSARGMSNRNSP